MLKEVRVGCECESRSWEAVRMGRFYLLGGRNFIGGRYGI